MHEHPVAADFLNFLRGSSTSDANRNVVRHLLAACRHCIATLRAIGWDTERLVRLVSLTALDPDDVRDVSLHITDEYDDSFARARAACEKELASPQRTRPQGEYQLDEVHEDLLSDELAIDAQDLVPEPALVKACLERSYAARHRDPARMLHWARLARMIAERCVGEAVGGNAQLADLRARAWGELGNALRVVGRLHEAERTLDRAESYRIGGTGDGSLKIELLGWRASLRRYERRFKEAISLLHEAEEICRQSADSGALAKCLLQRAVATLYAGDAETAIGILDETIPLIDPNDRRLLCGTYHNLISCYLEAGRLQEALALVPQTRSLAVETRDELMTLRVVWQEGRILSELGMLEEAEAHFTRARDGFIERTLPYETAIVSLDLTAIYLKLGLSTEVRRTVADVLPIFTSLGVRRELLAALLQLRQAQDQACALELIRRVSREMLAGPKIPTSV